MHPRQPRLWLMTDERVAEDRLLRGAARLPRGAGIILRHHLSDAEERARLAALLRRIARRRGLVLLVAGGMAAARAAGADGAHGRAALLRRASGKGSGGIRSAPAHDLAELRTAVRGGADLVFVSPLFATRSHPGARPLGAVRFAAIARRSPVPVMALGGVKRRHLPLLRRLGAAGYGAIDSLS